MKFNLAHKVLFVVAIPVVFQIGYLVWLSGSLSKLAGNQTIEQQATQALLLRDRLYVAGAQRFVIYGMYRATLDPSFHGKYHRNNQRILQAMYDLEKLWKDDPAKLEALKQSRDVNEGLNKAGTVLMNGEKQEQLSGLMGGWLGMHWLRGALDSHDYGLPKMDKIFAADEQMLADAEQDSLNLRNYIKKALFFGLVCSLVISAGSGLFFSISISGRLKRILANIKSMKERKFELRPAGGRDEISVLDRAIRETALEIRDAEEFQGHTVRIVAEELQRPLGKLASEFETLRQDGFETLTDKGAIRLDASGKEIKRLRMLVNELALIDTIKAVEFELNLQEMDLAEIARSAVEIVNDFAQSKTVRLETKLQSVIVNGDPNRLLQVTVNLLSNAIKFSPADGVVKVETVHENNSGRLSVADQGPGIPKEFRKRIFSSYEQASESDATEKKGSGLGLAISKKLLERHHGQIGFETEVGKGSTFFLSLPSIQDHTSHESSENTTTPSNDSLQSWTPTLWWKGLALVTLPLSVQVLTIIVLWLILSSVSDNVAASTRARKVVSIHRQIVTSIPRAMFYSMLYNVDRDQASHTSAGKEQKKLKELLKELAVLSSQDKHLSKASELEAMVDTHIQLENEVMAAEQDTSDVDRWFGPKNRENMLVQMERPMQEAIQLEQQAIDNRVLAAESIRKNIELVLLLSSILTGLVSVGLGLFMVRRLSQRIVLLLENTVRLSERSPLHKPLPGNDELAFVDHSLYEAAEKLTKLEQFKQEMIAVTSHELRTPLNSLLVLTELVEIGAFGPLKELGAKIQKEAHAQISELITMITDLLDLEKMQSGKMLVVKEASEIDSTLSAVATNLKPLGDKKGVEIRTNSSGLTADADPYRLTQALTAVLREIIEEVPEQSVISLNSQSNYKGVALKITAPCIRSSAENAPVKAKHPARERLAVDLSRVIAKQHGGDILIKSSKDERIVTLTFPQNAAASV